MPEPTFTFSEAPADEFLFEEAPRMQTAELVRKVVDHAPGLFHVLHQAGKAMLLVLGELRHAKLKYPHFAVDLDEALDVLDRERDELNADVLKEDIDGVHGVINEAARVAAVVIRIIEMAQTTGHRRCGDCGRPVGFAGCDSCRFAFDHPLWIPKATEASA